MKRKSIKELRASLEEVDGFACTASSDRAVNDLREALRELELAREVVKAAKAIVPRLGPIGAFNKALAEYKGAVRE